MPSNPLPMIPISLNQLTVYAANNSTIAKSDAAKSALQCRHRLHNCNIVENFFKHTAEPIPLTPYAANNASGTKTDDSESESNALSDPAEYQI